MVIERCESLTGCCLKLGTAQSSGRQPSGHCMQLMCKLGIEPWPYSDQQFGLLGDGGHRLLWTVLDTGPLEVLDSICNHFLKRLQSVRDSGEMSPGE